MLKINLFADGVESDTEYHVKDDSYVDNDTPNNDEAIVVK